jgi:cytoskeletal protein RodZ
MKELGAYLKETRINNGVSIDEAAQDLDIDNFLLESIEEGNTRAFKDILSMKDKVKEYAKYLGLKPEEVIDEFNDYLFEKTSKISLQDIVDADKGTKKEEKKIASPYTIVKPKKVDNKYIIYAVGLIIAAIFLVLAVFNLIRPKKEKITKELKQKSVGDYCEFAK